MLCWNCKSILHVVQEPHADPKMMYYKYVISRTVNPQEGALQMSGFQPIWRTKSTPCGVVSHINHPRVSHAGRRVAPPQAGARTWRRTLHLVSGHTQIRTRKRRTPGCPPQRNGDGSNSPARPPPLWGRRSSSKHGRARSAARRGSRSRIRPGNSRGRTATSAGRRRRSPWPRPGPNGP